MNKLFLLLKVQLLSLLTSTSTSSKKKRATGITMLLIPVAACLYVSVVYVMGMVEVFPVEYQYISIYIIGLMTLIMLLIFGYQGASGHLFGFKDYDLLMSLPVSHRQVLTSKFVSFLILEYIYAFFLFIPAIIIVGINCNYSLLYYVLSFVSWLFLPIVPITISAILSFFSMYFAGKFKYTNMMNLLFNIILIAAIIGLSAGYQTLIMSDISTLESISMNISHYLPFMGWMFDGIFTHNYLLYLGGICFNVIVFIAFVYLFANYFMKLNGQIKKGYTVKNYRLEKVKTNSSFYALFLKEVHTYFSNSVYVLNTALFPIMGIGSAAYLFYQKDSLFVMIPHEFRPVLLPLAASCILFFTLTCCTTNSSISIEGKSFYLLRSLPIREKDIFKAKIGLNLLVIIPLTCIAVLIASMALQFTLFDILVLLAVVVASAIFVSVFGLILNLHYYRLEWSSPARIVKQSLPVFITTIGGMGVSGVFIALTFFLIEQMNPFLLTELLLMGLVIIDIGCIFYLNKNGVRLFRKIN